MKLNTLKLLGHLAIHKQQTGDYQKYYFSWYWIIICLNHLQKNIYYPNRDNSKKYIPKNLKVYFKTHTQLQSTVCVARYKQIHTKLKPPDRHLAKAYSSRPHRCMSEWVVWQGGKLHWHPADCRTQVNDVPWRCTAQNLSKLTEECVTIG